MRISPSIAVVLAALTLSACEDVKFPGAPPPSNTEQTVPPPPIVPAETPATTPTEVTTAPTEIPAETGASTEAPAETGTIVDIVEETGDATSDEADVKDETPETVDNPIPAPNPYEGVENLLSINAVRCARTSEEVSQTLAQVANATRSTEASFTAQAVNGTAISTADFPGIVKMEPKRRLENGLNSSGHCGATRISKNWFITASHCLDETYDEIDLISTEASLLDPRAVRIQANSTICHAGYGGSSGQYANDVALVSISDEAAEAFADVPIARFGATDLALGALNYPRARMAGWGITSFDGGELSNDLLTTTLTMVASGPAAITVSSLDGSGPCIGDSGGPLMIDEADGLPKVIGVLSVVEQNRLTGEFCKGTYNARYTNLEGFIGWVDDVIGVCKTSPDLCAR